MSTGVDRERQVGQKGDTVPVLPTPRSQETPPHKPGASPSWSFFPQGSDYLHPCDGLGTGLLA